jgi:NAD(P)-dependent dehydrogenase (short-subunit alcohol dehydrogenase family)
VLCNNAGIERYAAADDYSIDDFNAIIETNLRGMFLCAKYAVEYLRESQGVIVNISSVQAFANEAKISVYAGSKAGILGLTRGMAVDFGPSGVRVNAVCPGAIGNTGMFENSLPSPGDAGSAVASVSKAVPLGRMGQPEDVARAVYFLASSEASYINGASLIVDGGLLARLALQP